jgi:hypothetical protein
MIFNLIRIAAAAESDMFEDLEPYRPQQAAEKGEIGHRVTEKKHIRIDQKRQ